jgi:hypothetical protein
MQFNMNVEDLEILRGYSPKFNRSIKETFLVLKVNFRPAYFIFLFYVQHFFALNQS